MPHKNNPDSLGHAETQDVKRIEPPRLYKVLLHNDDYTPMDFVVDILIDIFQKDEASAMQIMFNVHKLGKGLCGVYPREIAETKVAKVHEFASQQEFPLQASMEEE